jgi:Na+/H+ antiporter NhaC
MTPEPARIVSAPVPASGPLRFRGGTAGAVAPLALFLAGVSWLGLSGAPDEMGFWPVLLGALTLGVLLARDKEAYAEAVVGGMSRRLVMVMVLAWMLAGALATLLGASGMVDALVWAARAGGLAGGGYVAVAFLVAAVFSTATGTSLGTLLVCMPLLYPVGPSLGADPAFLAGALLGGATFGDNVSPISDTTIASAGTQGADLAGVVRSRLRYALPAAAVALLAGLVLGAGPTPGVAAGSVGDAAPSPTVAAWAMLTVPAFVLSLLLAKRPLLEALLYGILAAALLGLVLGAFVPGDLLGIDRANFVATGLLLDGMRRAVGISVFTLLLMGLVGGIEASGLVDRLVETARRRATGAASAEWWIFGSVTAAVVLTTHSVVAILAVGGLTREAGASFGLGPYRRANLLDVTVCTYPFLLPFFIPTILASSLTAGFDGAPRLSPWSAGLHNVHSWALLAVVLVAIATGWGRRDRPA